MLRPGRTPGQRLLLRLVKPRRALGAPGPEKAGPAPSWRKALASYEAKGREASAAGPGQRASLQRLSSHARCHEVNARSASRYRLARSHAAIDHQLLNFPIRARSTACRMASSRRSLMPPRPPNAYPAGGSFLSARPSSQSQSFDRRTIHLACGKDRRRTPVIVPGGAGAISDICQPLSEFISIERGNAKLGHFADIAGEERRAGIVGSKRALTRIVPSCAARGASGESLDWCPTLRSRRSN